MRDNTSLHETMYYKIKVAVIELEADTMMAFSLEMQIYLAIVLLQERVCLYVGLYFLLALW